MASHLPNPGASQLGSQTTICGLTEPQTPIRDGAGRFSSADYSCPSPVASPLHQVWQLKWKSWLAQQYRFKRVLAHCAEGTTGRRPALQVPDAEPIRLRLLGSEWNRCLLAISGCLARTRPWTNRPRTLHKQLESSGSRARYRCFSYALPFPRPLVRLQGLPLWGLLLGLLVAESWGSAPPLHAPPTATGSPQSLLYVDDLLPALSREHADVHFALVVLLLQVLKPPVSWKKALIGDTLIWCGWCFCFATDTVQLEPSKVQKLLSQIQELLASKKNESQAPGELPGPLRSFTAPLYSDLHSPRQTAYSINARQWPISSMMRPSADKSPQTLASQLWEGDQSGGQANQTQKS